MKPASTSMRSLPSLRRTRAGSRTSLQAHARALFDAQRLDAALPRIVLRWRARWSGNPRAVRAWPWRRGAAPPARPCGGRRPARSCRWSPAPAPRSAPAPASVRRSSSFSLAVSRFSHSRASSFSRCSSSRQLLAQVSLQRLGLFDAAVQFAQEARDVALAVAHGLARAPHDVFRHAEPRGDFQAGRFARQPQSQLVGGLEGLLVEAHGAVDHALGGSAVDLQRHQVRGDQREGAGRAEVLHDGHAQRAALFGIGGRAQLVQQHQRIRRHIQRHLADVGDVRRKGAEVFLDGLVVADIGQHLLEERELGFGGGHRQRRLRHQAEQPDGLQRHGLAAGVGAADQQRAALAASVPG